MPNPKLSRTRGIFLLPNLFTTAGLFAAFYSIVAAMQQQYESAAIAIFFALIADVLDGRVARLTNTQSEFGAYYDSLVDVISFGVAPALLMFNWSLHTLGKVGWLAAFIYTAATALRVARFNALAQNTDKRFFHGLACPAAAVMLASIVWFCQVYQFDHFVLHILFLLVILLLSLLMVSNVRYYGFKDIDLRKALPWMAALLIVLVIVTISLNPPLVILIGCTGYVLAGPIYTYSILVKKKYHLRRTQPHHHDQK
ncbi:MAG: CDP-diacylglycerol--serine O-phosphatidyltransferase [Legionellales bacterium]|nr:CDP-diacylglycerol--serine O-phosphatidyltransferase [Legionellales bacterium]